MATVESSESEEGFAEEAPLMAIFDKPAKTKIVSVFVAERGRDLSVSDIHRMGDVSRERVYEYLPELQELGIVVHTRDASGGHSPRYILNEESDIGELLVKLEGVTLKRLFESME